MNAGAVVAFLVITAAYLEFEFKGLLIKEATRDLETRARLVTESLESAQDNQLQERVARSAESSGARITIIDRSGSVKADSEAMAEEMDDHGTRPEIRDAIQTGVGTSVRFSNTRHMDFLYVAVTNPRNQTADITRVALPMRQVSSRLDVVRNSI